MYVQWFVKGISSVDQTGSQTLNKSNAFNLINDGRGILSNWWRNHPLICITPSEVQAVLTERNLDRHVHDYATFGPETPFISLACGSVERDALRRRNNFYSAVDTALDFATDSWAYPGALYYGWVVAAHNPAVELSLVAEAIRELNVYRRWSPFQLEGEITAKVHVPANQIRLVEWWDPGQSRAHRADQFENAAFVAPTPILNMQEYF